MKTTRKKHISSREPETWEILAFCAKHEVFDWLDKRQGHLYLAIDLYAHHVQKGMALGGGYFTHATNLVLGRPQHLFPKYE